jgi:hypothetical protein
LSARCLKGDLVKPLLPDRQNIWKRSYEHIRSGRVKPMVLLWALGVPLPIVLLIFLLRGCQ